MSLSDTIRNTLVPVRREGWPFIAAFGIAAIILGLVWGPLFWIGLILTAWCAYFFRDPERVVPIDDSFIISPADGVISAIGHVAPPSELNLGPEARLRISVFMNVFSVHVNRSPVRGRIKTLRHREGKFLNAELDKASELNERNGLVIEGPNGPVAAVQVAGLVARRILCWAQEGEEMRAGERFGLIRFGSRVDIYLPAGYALNVAIGQTAIAGETILAEFGSSKSQPSVRVD